MDDITHRLVNDWVALWNGDLAATDRIVAEDFTSHAAPLTGGEPGESMGRSALNGWVNGIHSVLRDLRFTVQLGPFRDTDTVVLRWRADGAYVGGVPGATAAVGQMVNFFGTDILRVERDGRIHEYWANADSLWFAQQIGLDVDSRRRWPRMSA